jgi:cold shock protein
LGRQVRLEELADSPEDAGQNQYRVRAKEGGTEACVARGRLKWFSEEKGQGFIVTDDGGDDIFVHYAGVEGSGFRDLGEGERVSYVPARGVGRAPRRGQARTSPGLGSYGLRPHSFSCSFDLVHGPSAVAGRLATRPTPPSGSGVAE